MGKSGGTMTAKAIGKKIKAKGLLKLKFYCQMCQKQCRDANGFKCHLQSESHLRQMSLFSENAGQFLDDFSSEFEKEYMSIVSTRYRNARVNANTVYNEVVAHRTHVHMNATKWHTLSSFVKYLGKSGQCVVEETEKGWFIRYIDRDPEALRRAAEKKKMAVGDELRERRLLQQQIERARQQLEGEEGEELQKVVAQEVSLDEPLNISMSLGGGEAGSSSSGSSGSSGSSVSNGKRNVFAQAASNRNSNTNGSSSSSSNSSSSSSSSNGSTTTTSTSTSNTQGGNKGTKRKLSALEEIVQQDMAKKERLNTSDNWVASGIQVRVTNQELADGKYYNKKGTVVKLVSDYVAEVRMKKSGDVLRLDQSHLETVLPSKGGRVLVLNGPYRGQTAVVLDFRVDEFKADVSIERMPRETLVTLPYEWISKIAS